MNSYPMINEANFIFHKKGGKLTGRFIKICSDRKGIEGYDKNGYILDGVYKT